LFINVLLARLVANTEAFAFRINWLLLSEEAPSTPAERAYQQEKARVTQMTEQDPMFKKYQVAELTKAYNTASPEEKNKIGLQIWAAT
jgi:hypothetical protein